jgi:hypothetical protein
VADDAARHREIFLAAESRRGNSTPRARWLGKLQGKTTSGIGSAKGTAMPRNGGLQAQIPAVRLTAQ